MPVMSEQNHLSAVITFCTVVLGHGDHVSPGSPWRGPNARYQGPASYGADITIGDWYVRARDVSVQCVEVLIVRRQICFTVSNSHCDTQTYS